MNDHLLLERARALGASDLSIDEVSLLVQRAMESEEFRDALGDIPGVPERLADWQQKEQRREQDEKIRDFPVQALAAAGTVFVMVVFGMTWLLVARPWETTSQALPETPAIRKEDPPKPPVAASPRVVVPKPVLPKVALETPIVPFPWDEQLTRQARRFADVWPDQLDSQHPVATSKDLREWFAPVTAHAHRIQDLNFGRYRVGAMRGQESSV